MKTKNDFKNSDEIVQYFNKIFDLELMELNNKKFNDINWTGLIIQNDSEFYKSTQFIEILNILKDDINWSIISDCVPLSEEIITQFHDYVNWRYISESQILSEGFIRKNQDYVYWDWISIKQTLSEEFIEEFVDCINWNKLFAHQQFSPEFTAKYQDKIDISEKIIENNNEEEICYYYDNEDDDIDYENLTTDFIRCNLDKINWDKVNPFNLEENIVREWIDEINWYYYARLAIVDFTEQFYLKFEDKILYSSDYGPNNDVCLIYNKYYRGY